jgi:two-component system LytT family response regulator
MMRCVLVDDEAPARERLRDLLGQASIDVEVAGEAGSGKEAVPLIHETRPDVVFLDVQMPVIDGFEVVELLVPPRPHIVFVTAYDEHALRAFEVHALDYLTKPVRLERLDRTLAHLAGLAAPRDLSALGRLRAGGELQRLTLHGGGRLHVVPVGSVRFFEAEEKSVFAALKEGKLRTDFGLDELETRLDPQRFLRIHRSYIVNAAAVRELVPWFSGTWQVKLDDGTQLPVARRRVAAVKQLLGSA